MYKDLSLYSQEPFTKDLVSIRDAIDILLSFSPNERLFNPEFGCNLDNLLFEPIDDITAKNILYEIYSGITRWDPRIRVNFNSSRIIPVKTENEYYLNLIFQVAGISGNYSYKKIIPRPSEA